MKTMRVRFVGVGACAAILFAGVSYARLGSGHVRQSAQGGAQADEITAPTHWVAFTADSLGSSPGDSRTVVGRYYRSSDGSVRRETGPATGDMRVISIENIGLERTFTRFPSGRWYSHPMKLPPSGWKPQRWRADRLRKVSWKHENFELYLVTEPSGDNAFLAPALNFFPVIRQTARGARKEYTNIQLGEPDPLLFGRPDGNVTHCPEPAGIVFTPPGEMAPQQSNAAPCGLKQLAPARR